MYDFLIVGSGLYGATVAHQLHNAGKSVLVIEKRHNIAGNVYTEKTEGIHVHVYTILPSATLLPSDFSTLNLPLIR